MASNPTTDVLPPPQTRPQAPAVGERTVDDMGIDPRILKGIARSLGLPDEYAADLGRVIVPVVIVKNLPEGAAEPTDTGSAYRIFTVDLATARDRVTIPGLADAVIGTVQVVALTGSVSLHIGDRDGIPLTFVGQAYKMRPPEQLKLAVTNAAQPGLTLQLLVGYGSGLAS